MSDRHRRQWEALGNVDPYWAVITRPDRIGGRWDPAEFFASGKADVHDVLERMASLGLAPPRRRALDYGCGVGRLSRALAALFDEVLGVDFSGTMLEEARRANAAIGNLEFALNDGRCLEGVADASVDFVYSVIALQHVPAAEQLAVISEFARVLRPGGVAVFQTPSRHNLRSASGLALRLAGNRVLNLARRWVYGKGRVMEVHPLACEVVLERLRAAGLEVRDVERYDAAGPGFESYRYYAAKPG